jgi:tol-pal system protein YbgF
MRIKVRHTQLVAATAAMFLSGCAASQYPTQQTDAQLRRTVADLREELDAVRRDQERLRAEVEHLQYASGSRGPTGTGVAPAPSSSAGWPTGRHSSDSSQNYSAADDRDAIAAVSSGGTGRVSEGAAPPTRGVVTGRGAPPPGAVPATDGTEETQAGIVAGVRGGGSWNQPGNVSKAGDVPTVPAALRGTGYDDAVRAYMQKQWDDSIQYFRDFLHASPTSPYADDAQYWIGECYLNKGLYSNAIKEFNQVVLRYGSSDRAPAALLKLSQVFSKIGDQVDARLSLQKLVNRYPGSGEAAEAYRLLQEMGG